MPNDVCEKMCDESDLKNGIQRIGFSTVAVYLHAVL
jgi:hypothetical protein